MQTTQQTPPRARRRVALAFLLCCGALPGCKYLVQQVASAIREVMRDENGLVRGEGTTVDGLHEGLWTFYYEDGRKRSQGRYLDDVQRGPWTAWYENGRVEWTGYYGDRGGRAGLWTYFHDNGEVRARGRYREDLELGRWEFHDRSGTLVRAGSFEDARQVGWWTVLEQDGSRASGLLHDGARVGPWTVAAAGSGSGRAGDRTTKTTVHDVPDGLVLVREEWPGGGLRRTGLLRDGEPVGGWASFAEDGSLAATAVLGSDGLARSVAVFDGDGALLAEGLLSGRDLDSWQLASARGASPPPSDRRALAADGGDDDREAAGFGERGQQPREPLPPLAPDRALWAPDAPGEPAELVAVRLAELRSPVPAEARLEAGSLAASTAVEPPAPTENPRIVAGRQPAWTVLEQKEIPDHVEAYLEKPKRRRASMSRYAVPPEMVGKPRRRSEMEGRPLAIQRLESTDGETVELADFHGRKRTLLVVLRGFFGQVCVYCVAQTEALSLCADRFDELNLEVLILYPGPKGNEQAFLAAYEETFGKGAPPYRVFYDPDLEITKQLGIAGGDLAYPTMIYSDIDGIVRYAYTGAHRADRPAAEEIIKFVQDLDRKSSEAPQ